MTQKQGREKTWKSRVGKKTVFERVYTPDIDFI